MDKAHRIKENSEIKELIKHKHSAGNRYFVVYKKNNHDMTHYRFAVSVSKKFGNAVKRNLAKRRVREIIRMQKINEPVDLFVVIKNNASNLTFQEQQKQLKFLLKKLNIKGD